METIENETIEKVLVDDREGFSWYVVRTRSRSERRVSDDLGFDNVRCYLPLYDSLRKYKDREVVKKFSLFSGYVFAYADYFGCHIVEDNKYVANLIQVNNTGSFLKELVDIEKALSSSRLVTPVAGLSVGQKVRVKKGPMIDVEGEIIKLKNRYSLILRASFIGQSVSVEIDASEIELID